MLPNTQIDSILFSFQRMHCVELSSSSEINQSYMYIPDSNLEEKSAEGQIISTTFSSFILGEWSWELKRISKVPKRNSRLGSIKARKRENMVQRIFRKLTVKLKLHVGRLLEKHIHFLYCSYWREINHYQSKLLIVLSPWNHSTKYYKFYIFP